MKYTIKDTKDVVIESGRDKSKEIIKLDDSVMREFEMTFTFKEVDYNVMIYNVSEDYIARCPEIVEEYCYNIINKLAREGHEFINGERIDFQKYLV